jgi:hypothetical protein
LGLFIFEFVHSFILLFTMARKKNDANGETISSGSGTTVRVSLNDQVLRDALNVYLDETKPDPLVLQQLTDASSWSWQEESPDTAVSAVAELLEEATHYLAGTATWSGAYASVDLRVQTCWKASATNSVDDPDNLNGSLVTVCHASARLGASSPLSSSSSPPKKSKEDKVQEKITSRMVERLRDDAYIAKWLLVPDKQQSKDSEPSLLYEARILLQNDSSQLEERVDTLPDVAEAIRRAVFFSAQDSLDVLEVVLALPWLPVVKHAPVLLSKNQTSALADRARLRLLEDAMCDACEQQGEEDMVQDLDIQAKKSAKLEE